MTHAHHSDVEVVDNRGAGMFSGMLLAIVALLIVMAIAFAVLWTRPWQSSSTTNPNTGPGISDNGGQSGGDGGNSGDAQQGGGAGNQHLTHGDYPLYSRCYSRTASPPRLRANRLSGLRQSAH